MVKMSEAENLKEFTEKIDTLTHLIPDLLQLDICLCDYWQSDFPFGKAVENNRRYTQNMLLFLSKNQYYNERDNYLFETRKILPGLEQEHEPQFIVLVPIHYNSWNLGYMAMYYENGGKYHIDTFLQYWRDSFANGLHTLRNSQKNCVTDYSVQLKRIRKEIYLSPQLEWNSENPADKLGISGGYFRKIYKLQFKIPFKEDHINARISRAKTLLSDTSLTIVEIAAQCGFNNASHFMRTFKAKEGKTAVQFRKGQ